VDDQFQQLLDALSPIAIKLKALEEEVERLETDKANLEGEINIEGEIDGVPAEISGLYEIVDIPTSLPTPRGPTNRPWRSHPADYP
jgi:hypothetical protein